MSCHEHCARHRVRDMTWHDMAYVVHVSFWHKTLGINIGQTLLISVARIKKYYPSVKIVLGQFSDINIIYICLYKYNCLIIIIVIINDNPKKIESKYLYIFD